MTTADPDNLFVRNPQLYLLPTLTSDKGVHCGAHMRRISTQGKRSIRFRRVEMHAKLPTGDWLWPAIWMLPEDSAYGPWPASGVIDILEARRNSLTY